MKNVSSKSNWKARMLRTVRIRGRRQWRVLGFWKEEKYPDWMMYVPNPLPEDE